MHLPLNVKWSSLDKRVGLQLRTGSFTFDHIIQILHCLVLQGKFRKFSTNNFGKLDMQKVVLEFRITPVVWTGWRRCLAAASTLISVPETSPPFHHSGPFHMTPALFRSLRLSLRREPSCRPNWNMCSDNISQIGPFSLVYLENTCVLFRHGLRFLKADGRFAGPLWPFW